jgi:Holliday junction resolvasome RuvABC DNA-binding subunit
MRRKRDDARRSADLRRQETARAADQARRRAADTQARAAAAEVITPLRLLGFRAEEARHAAALCETMPDASLEDRVRRALSYFHPRPRTVAHAAPRPGGAP